MRGLGVCKCARAVGGFRLRLRGLIIVGGELWGSFSRESIHVFCDVQR